MQLLISGLSLDGTKRAGTSLLSESLSGVAERRVDSVGIVSASLITYASIQALKPTLIINARTVGGFRDKQINSWIIQPKGACVGDIYLASDVAFHDRRIPIPESLKTA